ncbi:MAG TPA: hypothetical protein VF176_03130 [Solirubrobacterales bacterium]
MGALKDQWDRGYKNIAVDQGSGEVFGLGSLYVDASSPTGDLLRRFGFDTVAYGPGDSAADAQLVLRIRANAGTFTVCVPFSCTDARSTVSDPIPYNASPGTVENTINAMLAKAVDIAPSYNPVFSGTTVSVTGGVGNAAGDSPYTITFGGTAAGDQAPSLSTTALNLTRTGGGPLAAITTLAAGGGYEICEPAAGDTCKEGAVDPESRGGSLYFPDDIAVAPSSAPNAGNVLVSEPNFHRVEEYSPTGTFVREFGWDVIDHGPNDSSAHEVQKVTLGANTTGGRFSLLYNGRTTGAAGTGTLTSGSTTVNNVTTSNGAFAIGQVISADSGTGIPVGTTVTGVGANTLTLSAAATANSVGQDLTGNDIAYNASPAQVEAALNSLSSIGGAGGSVSVSGADGGPYTVTFGGNLGGDNLAQMTSSATGLTVSGGSKSATVSTTAEGGAFETCVAVAGDICKAGKAGVTGRNGSQLGQFTSFELKVAEDSSGAIYVVDDNEYRVQKLTPAAGDQLIPSLFGSNDEMQELTVNAGAGQFRLSYGTQADAVSGVGDFHEGSTTVTNVTPSTSQFKVGERITTSGAGLTLWPASVDVFITAIGPGTLTVSEPPGADSLNRQISSDLPYTTPDLPYDAPASGPGSVQAALNALPSISSGDGSVTVTGGPGDSSPYEISFDGGPLAKSDALTIKPSQGSTLLSGGSGPGADQATVVTVVTGGPNGTAGSDSPFDIAIDDADNVYVLKNYVAGTVVCPNGVPSSAEARIQRLDTAGTVQDVSVGCLRIRPGPQQPVNLTIDPVGGIPYVAYTGATPLTNGYKHRIYAFGDLGGAPELSLASPSSIDAHSVTISGTITPHGPADADQYPIPVTARYRVEYRKVGDPDWTLFAPDVSPGTSDSPTPFSVGVGGLEAKTDYEFRVVVEKPGFATVIGTKTASTTAGPPQITALSSSGVSASDADLHASINPQGDQTTYHFEYGRTPAYGQSTAEGSVGDGVLPVAVGNHIGGLDPVVYHFRVVAHNNFGTAMSSGQTFTFYPEPCPNATVRQQTGAGRLPDCRAYEIASPGDTGSGVILEPGGPQSPRATSPARVAFTGSLGAIVGAGGNPSAANADYVATRGSSGWTTRFVGLDADQKAVYGGPPGEGGGIEADLGLNRLLAWDRGQVNRTCCGLGGSMAPYVLNAYGDQIDRWPTAVEGYPTALNDLGCWLPPASAYCGPPGGFFGNAKPSPDFSHYFFSSHSVVFAPGGTSSGMLSVYDNDTTNGAIAVASKLPGGGDIPMEPGVGADDMLGLPAASNDGSHVLMAASGTGISGKTTNQPLPFLCGWTSAGGGNSITLNSCPSSLPSHLYMRVGGGVTYDVSKGHLVDFEGMTRDGTKIFFSSSEDLTGDGSDTDSSVDLYMWSEATDTVTLLSQGGGAGDTDACNAGWVAKCGAEVVGSEAGASIADTDNAIAGDAGDVYFYSPEQLVAGRGIPGRRNLYVARGSGLQLVATMDADKPASRIQVSPDGKHAAIVTSSKVMGYDNTSADGVCSRDPYGNPTSGPACEEMYAYDAEHDEVTCVSCLPDGGRPSSDVKASENGLFMSDDGRTFFSTGDALQPHDTNQQTDVYEYVGGRPQLISTGVFSSSSLYSSSIGLLGVSADGVDAYFLTLETLVAEDQNGPFVKVYDARTNGGFPVAASIAPCAAAEECHGSGSAPAAMPTIASGANLGIGGNATQRRGKKHGKKRVKHHSKRHRHHKRPHKHERARNSTQRRAGG